MTSTAVLADHIPGHENCDPEFALLLPGQEFWNGNGAIIFVTFLGPLGDSVITNTTFDIHYVSDGTTPASDLFMEISLQVDGQPTEFCLTGADLGFGSGPGTFKGTLETDVLNGVVGVGFFPPNSTVEFVVDAVGGGAIQGTAFFVDSSITFEVIPPPDCLGCPWDCADGDGQVGIVDFLALLAAWGHTSACDFDGGGIGIVDFLELLANWGPCP